MCRNPKNEREGEEIIKKILHLYNHMRNEIFLQIFYINIRALPMSREREREGGGGGKEFKSNNKNEEILKLFKYAHTFVCFRKCGEKRTTTSKSKQREMRWQFLCLWKLSKLIFGLSAKMLVKIANKIIKSGKFTYFGISWIKLTTIKLISLLLFIKVSPHVAARVFSFTCS
jgi:hypothetical protein